jgi:acyl-CoA synthetase (AMP-forming)/AMP-acid ligase II
MMLEVHERVAFHARRDRDRTAIVQVTPLCAGSHLMTYGQLHETIETMRDQLADRFVPGEVVLLCSWNRPEYVAAYLAALAADLTVFPVYASMVDAELREAAEQAGARGFLSTSDRFEAVQDMAIECLDLLHVAHGAAIGSQPSAVGDRPSAIGDQLSAIRRKPTADSRPQPAMLLQSSGTTGVPKIVYRNGCSLDAVAQNVAEAVGLSERDRVLAAIPLCHSYGVENGLLAPLYAGCTVHVCNGFDTTLVMDHIAREGITVFPGTPFMFEMLSGGDPDMRTEERGHGAGGCWARSLRAVYSAGAALPQSVSDAFRAETSRPIGQLYGSTEIGSVTFSDPAGDDYEPDSVGKAMSGVDIRILDVDEPCVDQPRPVGEEGHVAVRSPSMLDRYVNDPQPALSDRYFLTGDLGKLSAAGNLTITGRVKLQINVGGLKVNPLEIERVLMQHPQVGECVVVPMPVTETLDRLRAVVTPREASDPPSSESLREFARERLSCHKIPRIFELRESLPRTPTGKILRSEIQMGASRHGGTEA